MEIESPLGSFIGINKSFRTLALEKLPLKDLETLSGAIDQALREQNAYIIRPIYYPLVIDHGTFEELSQGALTIMRLQRRLLKSLLHSMTKHDLMNLFGIKPELLPFMNWAELTGDEEQISRFDAVLCKDGHFRFCEINTDPAIGGAELFEIGKAVFDKLEGLVPDATCLKSPYRDIADHVARRARHFNCQRVVILTFERNYAEGYFDYSEFLNYLQSACGEIPVFRCSEITYSNDWLTPESARRTLVYRFFSDEDMTDGGRLFRDIVKAGTRLVSGLETYFYQSKQWFAILHDPSLRESLTDPERAAVQRFMPQTRSVSEDALPSLLAEKDRWVFKADLGSCGKAVFIGQEHSAEELTRHLRDTSAGNWTAQEFLESPTLDVAFDGRWTPTPAYVVFGLYITGDRPSGMNIRASTYSRVVNVSSGKAATGWCVPISDQTRSRS